MNRKNTCPHGAHWFEFWKTETGNNYTRDCYGLWSVLCFQGDEEVMGRNNKYALFKSDAICAKNKWKWARQVETFKYISTNSEHKKMDYKYMEECPTQEQSRSTN